MNTVTQAVQVLNVRYSIRPANDKLDKRFGRFIRYVDLDVRLSGPAFQEINRRTQQAALDRWPAEIVGLLGEFIQLPEKYAILAVDFQPDQHYLTVGLMMGFDEYAEDVRRVGFEAEDFEDDKLDLKDDSDEKADSKETASEATPEAEPVVATAITLVGD